MLAPLGFGAKLPTQPETHGEPLWPLKNEPSLKTSKFDELYVHLYFGKKRMSRGNNALQAALFYGTGTITVDIIILILAALCKPVHGLTLYTLRNEKVDDVCLPLKHQESTLAHLLSASIIMLGSIKGTMWRVNRYLSYVDLCRYHLRTSI